MANHYIKMRHVTEFCSSEMMTTASFSSTILFYLLVDREVDGHLVTEPSSTMSDRKRGNVCSLCDDKRPVCLQVSSQCWAHNTPPILQDPDSDTVVGVTWALHVGQEGGSRAQNGPLVLQ